MGVSANAVGSARAALVRALAERRQEIEQAALTRIHAIGDPARTPDPEYADGLRAAVGAAIGYGLAGVEWGEDRAPATPAVLLTQARLAARSGVSLDTVLRRYVAGQALLGDFLIEEAERAGLDGPALKRLLRSQAVLFDRLIATIGGEYGREPNGGRADSSERRRAEKVQRLLAGELVDASELGYGFEGHHIGLIAAGADADTVVRDLATALDRRLLAIRREDRVLWAWLGGRRPLDAADLDRQVMRGLPGDTALAIGEPSQGIEGWRLTHRQARAAMRVANRSSEPHVRYADVALLASALGDELLVTSLRKLYLEPLEAERDGGEILRCTLRAYFAADRNTASAAAALGVSRRTVANRLATVEGILGCPVGAVTPAMEAALSIHESHPLAT